MGLSGQIRLKEKGAASEVVVVSVGPKGAQEQIRTALALVGTFGLLDFSYWTFFLGE